MSVYSGHENLEILSKNQRFNDWIYDEISTELKGDILELGSGIGTFSERIIYNSSLDSNITLTDVDGPYIKKLEERFLGSYNNISVKKLDLNSKTDYELIGYEKFDSIVAINVLEHIENDDFALQQLYKMLRKDGVLVVLVPCHKFLYNVIDKEIGHFRRYSKHELESKIKKTPFRNYRLFHFNVLGIIGWYINGNLARKTKINNTASQVFDRLVPLSRYFERTIGKKIGLSIICCLSKN